MVETTGARYLARALDAAGTTAVFLVPTVLSATLVAMEQETGIRRIVTHGEKAAAYMADGYARASGRVGVCMAQNIGAANLAAGLRDAVLGCSPVLAITGGPYPYSRGRNYYQEIEDLPLFKPVTRSSRQVFEAERLPDQLAQALRDATVGKPGPVHLELAGHTGDLVENGTLDAPPPPPREARVPGIRIEPDRDAVRAAAAAIAAAERPVVVAGGGVRASGAAAEVVALAERIGAPIATSMNGKDTVPSDHPLAIGIPGLYARASANQVLLEADLVIYVGSQTGSQLTLTWQVPPPETRVVHLDIEPSEPGRHYADTLPLVADARSGLRALLEALPETDLDAGAAWRERARELAARWREEVARHVESEAAELRPERLVTELSRLLPEDAIVVADTGHAGMWTAAHLDLAHPGQGFIRAAGSLGWGLPAGIGAQIARPDARVVVFTGDGGLLYHLSELETAARWQIPLTIVVNDNSSLNQEINPYTVAYGGELSGRHGELWHFRETDLAAVAESLGVTGIRVTSASGLASAIAQADETPGPVLIDVVTDRAAVAPKGSSERAR
ncbi:thiamine pyrophosphate-binding protein [Homoserinibacter sp. YIM 151385]|uniref:thiamine pyrophosphate-binding protein n=1 Tax=Homoserinibacter sp. YIM 151385 TaxID=2985506 RepID=UPI0022F011E2|nr:thiamine pyrophosphate-binding protein [Homoserinibacter sp. YIM 151385]WBU37104.1 thiamine pyrophosphate-binding protein [Homoserinibacter sp. YIM 151385]